MPSIYDLKPAFQALLRPLMRTLRAAGATPNTITSVALVGSIAVGVGVGLAGRQRMLLLLLPVWLFVRMALNALDGMMAREMSMATRLGGALNEVGDVVSDLALYLPLAFVGAGSIWPAVAFAIGAALTEFCGVLGTALGSTRRYEGPMGKSDRAFVVGALGALGAFFPTTIEAWPYILSAGAALEGLTCWNRLQKALT